MPRNRKQSGWKSRATTEIACDVTEHPDLILRLGDGQGDVVDDLRGVEVGRVEVHVRVPAQAINMSHIEPESRVTCGI